MALRMFQAAIQLKPREVGGKSVPVWSGYRSLIRFEDTELDIGFELQFYGEPLEAGEQAVGCISMWAGEFAPELAVGLRFEIREGPHVVGHGTVLDPDGCMLQPQV